MVNLVISPPSKPNLDAKFLVEKANLTYGPLGDGYFLRLPDARTVYASDKGEVLRKANAWAKDNWGGNKVKKSQIEWRNC